MDAYRNPSFIASGHDPIGGSWVLSILDGPDGPMLWVRSDVWEGGGSIAPLDGRVFGALSYGTMSETTPLIAAEVDGIVTARAWLVQAELADRSRLDAYVARIPETVAPELSAFVVFIPSGQRPAAVIAFDQDGHEIGRQGLINIPGD